MGHHLNKFGSTGNQVSRLPGFRFKRKKIFKRFYMYGHGGHVT